LPHATSAAIRHNPTARVTNLDNDNPPIGR
jgi:hypothetical protein